MLSDSVISRQDFTFLSNISRDRLKALGGLASNFSITSAAAIPYTLIVSFGQLNHPFYLDWFVLKILYFVARLSKSYFNCNVSFYIKAFL